MQYNKTLIIAGTGRCGTSLSMQMLDAAGFPVFGRPCMYEEEENHVDRMSPEFLTTQRGRAVKMVNPLRTLRQTPLVLSDCEMIWLKRDYKEQAKSAIKYADECTGFSFGKTTKRIKEVAGVIRKDNEESTKVFRSLIIRTQSFEMLLKRPDLFLQFVQDHTGIHLDIPAALDIMIERGPKNFDGLLEKSFINNPFMGKQ